MSSGIVICSVLLLLCAWTGAHGQSYNEGLEFMVAFPPSPGNSEGGNCNMVMVAREFSTVTIHDHAGQLHELDIFAGSQGYYPGLCQYRTISGTEFKGIRVSATTPISIWVFTEDPNSDSDGYMMYPTSDTPGQYSYRMTGVLPGRLCPGTNDDIVISAGVETVVDIYMSVERGLFDTFILEPFQTYTLTAAGGTGGWLVVGDRPLTVINGAACSRDCTGPRICTGDQTWDSVYETRFLGTEYISFPIIDQTMPGEDAADSEMDLILTTNMSDTEFYVPGASNENFTEPLAGYHMAHEFAPAFLSRGVMSDRSSAVAVFNVEHHGPTPSHSTGMFYVNLIPVSSYSNDLLFALAEASHLPMYLSVVVDRATLNPGELFLNGQDILELSGEVSSDGPFGSASVNVVAYAAVVYHLTTTAEANVRFAAYAYGFNGGEGFAYSLGLSDIVEEPRTTMMDFPTTEEQFMTTTGIETTTTLLTTTVALPTRPPPPPGGYNPPWTRISVFQDFASSDGSNFTSTCTFTFSDDFANGASSIRQRSNDDMNSICPNEPETLIAQQATTFFTNLNEGTALAVFWVNPDPIASIGGTPECLVAFLTTVANWGTMFRTSPECNAAPVFVEQNFDYQNDGSTCVGIPSRPPLDVDEFIPTQSIQLSSTFELDGGTELDPLCLFYYSIQLQDAVDNQHFEIDIGLALGDLCPYINPEFPMFVYRSEYTFTDGYAEAEFWLMGSDGISWEEKELCAHDVMEHITPFANGWTAPPFAPEAGCPYPNFDSRVSWDSVDRLWQC